MLVQNKKNLYTNAIQTLIASILFLVPTNLFKKIFENSSYIHNLQVDYVLPKIYITDIFLLILFVTLSIISKNNFKNKKTIACGLFLFLLLQNTTAYPIVALLFTFRIVLLISSISILLQNKTLISQTYNLLAIKLTLIFQSVIALYQFVFQKSVYNYYFLGETNLHAYAGLAKTTLFGVEKVLPYGTTAHPNILAGILTLYLLILMNACRKYASKIDIFIFILAVFTLCLTQSFSALLGLILGIGVLEYTKRSKQHITPKKILITYIVAIFVSIVFLKINIIAGWNSTASFYRREYLNTAAIQMFLAHPFFGVGLQNFTAHLESFSNQQEVVRFVQPVHNSFLLILTEVGLVGIAIAAAIIYTIRKKIAPIILPEYLFALLPMFVLDHYLVTLQSGILLLFILIIVSTQHTMVRHK